MTRRNRPMTTDEKKASVALAVVHRVMLAGQKVCHNKLSSPK